VPEAVHEPAAFLKPDPEIDNDARGPADDGERTILGLTVNMFDDEPLSDGLAFGVTLIT